MGKIYNVQGELKRGSLFRHFYRRVHNVVSGHYVQLQEMEMFLSSPDVTSWIDIFIVNYNRFLEISKGTNWTYMALDKLETVGQSIMNAVCQLVYPLSGFLHWYQGQWHSTLQENQSFHIKKLCIPFNSLYLTAECLWTALPTKPQVMDYKKKATILHLW